jgi:hypothetical protein
MPKSFHARTMYVLLPGVNVPEGKGLVKAGADVCGVNVEAAVGDEPETVVSGEARAEALGFPVGEVDPVAAGVDVSAVGPVADGCGLLLVAGLCICV